MLAATINTADAADPSGLWLTKDGDKIRIAACGAAACGTIAALKQPNDPATGRPFTDKNNPNAGLRNRPLIGVQVFSMQPSGANKWSGKIYVADDGKQYDASVQITGPNSLKVEACAGFLLCHSGRLDAHELSRPVLARLAPDRAPALHRPAGLSGRAG